MPLDPTGNRLLWKSDLRPMQMYGEHEKTYTPLSCLLSQNDKGRLDLPTNGPKKALCGRDWVSYGISASDNKMNLAAQH